MRRPLAVKSCSWCRPFSTAGAISKKRSGLTANSLASEYTYQRRKWRANLLAESLRRQRSPGGATYPIQGSDKPLTRGTFPPRSRQPLKANTRSILTIFLHQRLAREMHMLPAVGMAQEPDRAVLLQKGRVISGDYGEWEVGSEHHGKEFWLVAGPPQHLRFRDREGKTDEGLVYRRTDGMVARAEYVELLPEFKTT